ncbi:mitochondrial amidoxime-reducing component 1 isoform X1 [Osmia lignaria lignaria]|uniref:mitochondrial amidoxime-reducing component 1 isoform X1 n=1 Tax=Osmia lignaria lignaria TaxID=1437193 RepID=UPI001478C66B|nr:mitochondrial amidoxime-reducing component 1-like isoform X1 [Osmia lignaria]
MQAHSDWRSTIIVTCSFAIVFVAFVWNVRKNSSEKEKQPKKDEKEKADIVNGTISHGNDANDEPEEEEQTEDDTISELPDPNWVKVGQVRELYIYPLKSGRGKELRECNFTEYGISVENQGFTLRDRMFLVYNEETGRFQTGRQYPTLILVSLSAVDESRVKLEALGMPRVMFTVPKSLENSIEAVQCKMWWGEPVKCIDCGQEPAEWISRFLTGTNSGLRLGYTMMDKRDLFKEPWKKYTEVYQTIRNEDTGLFCDLASYMLMTVQSVDKLNEKLETPVPALQFRPNILLYTKEAFSEDDWEWIKIGERAVVRNVKPCTRCKFVLVNPDNGVMDDEEPLKTLKTFRQLTDPKRLALEGTAPKMGIYCGLYVPGKVKIDDDVFVHIPNKSSIESNHRETK